MLKKQHSMYIITLPHHCTVDGSFGLPHTRHNRDHMPSRVDGSLFRHVPFSASISTIDVKLRQSPTFNVQITVLILISI
jgi:hypothetical protein